ncbi:MAG: type II toxin-antitoxin system prevent-host-death family antitoxin [Actinomycetota bacterium]|nr:type II toxin-antitoxin system prevent-host-death family antitoxin [Actinomycetota bacterium]
MASIGVRELKQNASQMVSKAAAGESLVVTDRGRPVARLVPLLDDPLAQLAESGEMRPARTALSSLSPTRRRKAGEASLSAELAAMRDADDR